MPSRLAPLLPRPVAFAHRGARAHAPENTIEAFRLALRLGATGLESDVWLSADGDAVLDHDGVVGRWPRRRPVAQVQRADLPGAMPTLDELFSACGSGFDLSLDLKDPASFDVVVGLCRTLADPARVWICHPDLDLLTDWRRRDTGVRLVHSWRTARMSRGLERHAADLAELGIDALNLPVEEWTGGAVTLCHRFDRLAFAWDAQHERQLLEVLDMGIDAVYSDYVDRLVDALGRVHGS